MRGSGARRQAGCGAVSGALPVCPLLLPTSMLMPPPPPPPRHHQTSLRLLRALRSLPVLRGVLPLRRRADRAGPSGRVLVHDPRRRTWGQHRAVGEAATCSAVRRANREGCQHWASSGPERRQGGVGQWAAGDGRCEGSPPRGHSSKCRARHLLLLHGSWQSLRRRSLRSPPWRAQGSRGEVGAEPEAKI